MSLRWVYNRAHFAFVTLNIVVNDVQHATHRPSIRTWWCKKIFKTTLVTYPFEHEKLGDRRGTFSCHGRIERVYRCPRITPQRKGGRGEREGERFAVILDTCSRTPVCLLYSRISFDGSRFGCCLVKYWARWSITDIEENKACGGWNTIECTGWWKIKYPMKYPDDQITHLVGWSSGCSMC